MILWSISFFSCVFFSTVLLHIGEGGGSVVTRNLTEELDFSVNFTKNSTTSRDKRNGVLGLYLNPHDPLSRIAAVLWAKIFEKPYALPTKPYHHLTGIVTTTTALSTTEKPPTTGETVTDHTGEVMMAIDLPHSTTTSSVQVPSSVAFPVPQMTSGVAISTQMPRPTTMIPSVKPSDPNSPSGGKPSGQVITNPNQPMKPQPVNPGFPGDPGQVQQPQNPAFPNQPQHPGNFPPPGQHAGQGQGQGNPNFPGQGQPNFPGQGQGNPNLPGQINPNFPGQGQGNQNFPQGPQNVPPGGFPPGQQQQPPRPGGFPGQQQPPGPIGFPGQQNFPQNQNPGQIPPGGGGGSIFGQPQQQNFQRPPQGVQGIIRLGSTQPLYHLNQQQQTIEAQLQQPPFQQEEIKYPMSQDQLYEFLSTQQQQQQQQKEFNAAINNQHQVEKNNDGQVVFINPSHSNFNNSSTANNEQRPILVYHPSIGGGQSGTEFFGPSILTK